MVNIGLKICSRCILPENFPGIKFDGSGVCKHCRQEEKIIAEAPEKKERYRQKLDELILEVKGKSLHYDVIMAYSGGKDSSYTLKLLKDKYDLRILALTFDNHFVAPISWENIRKIADHLGVDHISFRYSWPTMKSLFTLAAQEDIFPMATLLRASSICTVCISIVKNLVLKSALEMEIPLAAFGWSPGQAPIQSAIMKTNAALMRHNQAVLKKALLQKTSQETEHIFMHESYFEKFKDRFPINIHPLAFFDYDESRIKAELGHMGWEAPKETDTNSTNCLLNSFANEEHLQRYGFHPYVMEIANMVRQGSMTREEGIEKIYGEQDAKMVAYAKRRLGL